MDRDDAERMQGFRLRSSRMEAFSDGVFAIAITLLVLEISVPTSDEGDLLQAIIGEWPSFLAYLVSFFSIGAIWLGHTSMTEFLREVSPGFLRLNLLLLLFVAFLPLPTRLLAENTASPDAERVAVTLYGSVLLVTALCLSTLWRFALREELVRADRTGLDVRLLTRRLTPSLGFYLMFIVVGLFFPTAAVFGYMLVAIGLVIPLRRIRGRV
ncbi:MAG TPA: TMEM175 family protein [Terrimesophilobacter sp.]|jgi:Predicted integral membrane protein|uniref:TMEM175 family protein n=1 Tax=Terrimesophilobacter sp. TaxID=2906435 RepID=UPI002F95E6B0